MAQPKVTGAEARDENTIRVSFDQEMTLDSELLDVGNYSPSPITPGAAPLFVSSVSAESVTYPTYVDLTVSEMTDAASYELSVSDAGPVSRNLETVDPLENTASFTGIGSPPEISQVVAIGPNRVDVIFNESMTDNADIRDPGNYQWDGGLITAQVLNFSQDTVQLATSDQEEGKLYTLTVTY